jgi:hypothetical protein
MIGETRPEAALGLLCRGYRINLDRPGPGVQRAPDRDLSCREPCRRPLVAQRVELLAVIETVRRVVHADASNGALGVGWSHSHSGMIGSGTHVVRDGAGERLRARGGGYCSKYEKTPDQMLHAGLCRDREIPALDAAVRLLFPGCHEMGGRRPRIHDPHAARPAVVGQSG